MTSSDVDSGRDDSAFEGATTGEAEGAAAAQRQIERARGLAVVVEQPSLEDSGIFHRAEQAVIQAGIDEIDMGDAEQRAVDGGREQSTRRAVTQDQPIFGVVQRERAVEALHGAEQSVARQLSLFFGPTSLADVANGARDQQAIFGEDGAQADLDRHLGAVLAERGQS